MIINSISYINVTLIIAVLLFMPLVNFNIVVFYSTKYLSLPMNLGVCIDNTFNGILEVTLTE